MAEFCAFDWGVRFNPALLPAVENNSKRDKKTLIHNLKLLAQSRPDLGNPRTDNEFLERFLKARKYVFNEGCDLYVNYYLFRQKNSDVFNRLNGQDVLIQQALRDGFPGVLDRRDRRGRCILLFIASRWNYSCYSLLTIFRSLLLTLEFLIAEEINQHRGFVFVIDWTEFTFKQSSNLSPKFLLRLCVLRKRCAAILDENDCIQRTYEKNGAPEEILSKTPALGRFYSLNGSKDNRAEVLKLMIDCLQDCFPAKFKGIHFIGQPWYVEVALAFIKPFLKEKSKERIRLHGNNLSTLHQYIAGEILPSELGGEGPPFNPLPWAEKLMSQSLE